MDIRKFGGSVEVRVGDAHILLTTDQARDLADVVEDYEAGCEWHGLIGPEGCTAAAGFSVRRPCAGVCSVIMSASNHPIGFGVAEKCLVADVQNLHFRLREVAREVEEEESVA